MRKFKIFLHGKNYLMRKLGEVARKHGFYVTVFVEARNPEEAEALAMDVLKNDSKIQNVCENKESDVPMLLVESSEEIESFEGCKLPRTGLAICGGVT